MKEITEKEVEDRANQFWSELDGIIDFLNRANPRLRITDHRDPTITQYLLWRILVENKLSNQKTERNLLKEFKQIIEIIKK